MHKEEMFKTAFSPTFNTHVGIDRAWKDDRGVWIFSCNLVIDGEKRTNFLFRACELRHFVL